MEYRFVIKRRQCTFTDLKQLPPPRDNPLIYSIPRRGISPAFAAAKLLFFLIPINLLCRKHGNSQNYEEADTSHKQGIALQL